MQPSKLTSLDSPLKQFSLSDQKVQSRDHKYWSREVSYALEVYAQTAGGTVADNEDHLEAKAVACATLAGLGLALHQHFGQAVEALGCDEHQLCVAAGLRAIDSGKAHTDKMEAAALKTLS